MHSWQLQDAKARLSEVVKSANTEGPQEITLRGQPAAVVLSAEDYARLTGKKTGLVEFLRKSPMRGIELGLERDTSLTREVPL
ncbi:MAG TPA: type II toxin-antitoxin system Phd/YefM family antitoxin [Parasulfuritortus sp.]